MMEKKIEVSENGIYLLSPETLISFLNRRKIRTWKVLEYFQKNHEDYLQSIKEGVWLPILPVDSIEYIIKVDNIAGRFNNDWVRVFHYSGFNLDVGNDNMFWVGSFGNLLKWSAEKFTDVEKDSISYETLDHEILTSAVRFGLEKGKYLVSISGYKRTHLLNFPEVNFGYLFEFQKTKEFDRFQDPRKDEMFHFNIPEA